VGALATLWCAAPAAAMPIYLEASGQVVMEAELFSTRGPAADLPDGTAGGDAEQWLIITSESASSDPFTGARGEFLQVLDAGGIAGEGNFSDPEGIGPFVDYVMSITTTGTYEFFPRWDSPGGSHDSFYMMLFDPIGVQIGATATIAGHRDLDFTTEPWHDLALTYSIPMAGDYTIRLAPREDGVAVDALIFQLESLTDPSGLGPPRSAVIPEPGTALLVLTGLAAMAASRRSRVPLQIRRSPPSLPYGEPIPRRPEDE
jgi:hypothetical protein